jgi:hypothetical protein
MKENFKLVPRNSEVVSNQSTDRAAPVANESQSESPPQPPTWMPVAVNSLGDGANGSTGDPPTKEVDEDANNADGGETGGVDGVTTPLREHSVPRPSRPSIMERFALGLGFQKDGNDRYFHDDGSWITKPGGSHFWERHAVGGSVLRYYWAKDHCLESDPLQIDAEVWGLIDRFPGTYAFILADPQERPVELIGSRLQSMKNDGFIKLYPASYRVVYNADAGS